MELRSRPADVIRALNHAWRTCDAEALAALLTPEVIVLTAAFDVVAEGREKTVESYISFAREARVLEFEEYDWNEHVLARIAIVTYRYRIEYQRADEHSQDRGNEMFVLVDDSSSWRASCRLLLSD